jgi:N-dimethylarginine dimethylaminohydrolase
MEVGDKMKKLNEAIQALEQEYNSIDYSDEERDLVAKERAYNDALAKRNAKVNLKKEKLDKLNEMIFVRDKYLEVEQPEETVEGEL